MTAKKSGITTKIYEKYDSDTIESFAGHLRIVPGESYDDQNLGVVDALSREYRCSAEEARIYYYPAALNGIVRLAIQARVDSRRTTKERFLEQLDSKKYLYTTWHAEVVGNKVFVEQLAKDLSRNTRIKNHFVRFLAITLVDARDIEPAAMLARILTTKYYGAGKLHTALPWTLIVDASDDVLHLLKSALASAAIAFNDGYEAFGFNVELFGKRPVTARRGRSNQIGVTSFDLWIVSLTNFNKHQALIAEPNLVLVHAELGRKFPNPIASSLVVELGSLALSDLNHVMERIR
ncbi:hypothetical protein [Pseudonocardia xinjiangensis]|uniref:Uncharacterized protein n=1 Tax=Pseudonocardia xinjiangensis TaxID=75289 RepID=A0ABX1RB33_9PSEU|nr:hypothetical protein [Pseudonocardia xinjiangensis]NMH77227.1 hypothetical protein [Pseudonocardia xinjiangensis]